MGLVAVGVPLALLVFWGGLIAVGSLGLPLVVDTVERVVATLDQRQAVDTVQVETVPWTDWRILLL
jgi:hypothetical protein